MEPRMMIPFEDFVAAADATRRRQLILARVLVSGLCVGLIAELVFAIWLPWATVWLVRFATPFLVIWMFGALAWLCWSDAAPRCLYCGANTNLAWTIATRNCRKCGKEVLEEPAFSEKRPEWEMSANEFNRRSFPVLRRKWKLARCWST